MSTQTIDILQKPTFDLIDWEITDYDSENQILFCQTTKVLYFNKCKGTIINRSRVLRPKEQECKYVQTVIGAFIDAGFCGKLVFKIKLNNIYEVDMIKRLRESFEEENKENKELRILLNIKDKIQNSVQLSLDPFPNNYYNGTNQTTENPDITFTSNIN